MRYTSGSEMDTIGTVPGVKLADCRRLRYLTQAQLAVKAGVSPATVSSIERGLHPPRMGVMRRLADALGVEPSEVDEFKVALPPNPAQDG